MRKWVALVVVLVMVFGMTGGALAAPPKPVPEPKCSFVGYQWEYYGSYYLGVAVTNDSDVLAEVSANVVFKDESGAMIGTESGHFFALEPGCTSFFKVRNDAPFASYDVVFSTQEDRHYWGTLASMTMEINTTDKKAIVSVTNNGEYVSEYTYAHVLFFSGDTCIYGDSGFAGDSSTTLNPGKTGYAQVENHAEGSFDSVKVFLSGHTELGIRN